jgi:hypothetical protein
MDLKKLGVLAIVLTLTLAIGLVSVNFAEAAGSSKGSLRNNYGAQLSGGSGSGGNSANQGIGKSQ